MDYVHEKKLTLEKKQVNGGGSVYTKQKRTRVSTWFIMWKSVLHQTDFLYDNTRYQYVKNLKYA